jgi:lipopolysaccharide export system permease protein
MGVLIGVLLGIGRLSSDQELIAARACGISLYRLAAPVILLATALFPLALVVALKFSPEANVEMHKMIHDLTRTSASAVVAEKIFNHSFPGVTVYFEQSDHSGTTLLNVLVSDSRDAANKSIFVAKTGTVIPGKGHSSIRLRLKEGWTFGSGSADNRQHFARFATYDIEIDLQNSLGKRKLAEFSMAELRTAIMASPNRSNVWAETEIARRWMISSAVIPFAVLGMILGLTRVRGGRYERMVFAVLVFFIYHVVFRSSQALGQAGTVNPYLVVSAPNVVFTIGSLILLQLSASDLEAPGRELGSRIRRSIELKLQKLG